MDIHEVKTLIKHLYKLHRKGELKIRGKQIPIMFVGATGVGKTQVVDQCGDEISNEFVLPDFRVINLRLSQKEQGDLVGSPFEVELVPCPYCVENGDDGFHQDYLHVKHKLLQHIEKVHGKQYGKKPPSYQEVMDIVRSKYSHLITFRTGNMVPDFLPTSGHGIIHLDEYNRAQLGVRNAAFEFVEKGCLGKYKLPEGWIVLSSINPPTEEYIVHDIDEANVARFCWILFCPKTKEWLDYASEIGLNPKVINFIRMYPQMLGNDIVDYPYEPHKCPRTVEMMGHLLEGLDEKLIWEVAAGCIGHDAATAYIASLKDFKKPVPASKILDDYEGVRKTIKEYSKFDNNRADLINISIEGILKEFDKKEDSLKDTQVHNIYLFMKDVSKDTTVGFLKKLSISKSENVQMHFRQLSKSEEIRNMIEKEFSSIGRGSFGK